MKTKCPAVWCLVAWLCGCSTPGLAPQAVVPGSISATTTGAALGQPTSPPPADQVGLVQRADRLASRVREKVAQVPTRTQDLVDAAGESDVVVCMMPVVVAAGFVVAILGGGRVAFGGLGSGCATPSQ
jgi:hypothetical protein